MKRLKALALIGATVVLGLSDIELGMAPQFNLLSTPAEAQRNRARATQLPYVAPRVTTRGVARRTARRTIRRTAVTYASLPPACVSIVIDGYRLYNCGGFYVQYSGGVYVEVVFY